jgi:hypothetical protein
LILISLIVLAAITIVGVRQHKDPSYVLKRKEHDIGLQDGPSYFSGKRSIHIQTEWFPKVNNSTQYAPVSLENDVKDSTLSHTSLISFLREVRPRLEEALQQNETIDIFRDEFSLIAAEEDLGLGNKGNFLFIYLYCNANVSGLLSHHV